MFGTHSRSWVRALSRSAPVWQHIGIGDVRTLPGDDPQALRALLKQRRNAVVIPLMEAHARLCPRDCRSLFPSLTAVDTLGDKGRFADYVDEHGLGDLCPRTYAAEAPVFPCVLKRTDLNASAGVTIVRSADHLRDLLCIDPWRDRPFILQELVASAFDHVTHAVCRDGEILWHRTYTCELAEPQAIQRPGNAVARGTAAATDATLAAFARVLAPLGYDGPVAIDHRFSATGALKILEMNPRLGGSLMAPDKVEDLAGALGTILRHAVQGAFERVDGI
ncbi:hypothetical protein [Ensifer soli]|uniref:hypothetical protein n=1 Tax=Ciceribacter sp. sgz301302 TaxID=3342379 RepID=UPI0035BC0ABF